MKRGFEEFNLGTYKDEMFDVFTKINTGLWHALERGELSFEELKKICNAVSIPVVAIGGIGKSNIEKLSGTGIDGVALVSAIFASEDIENECKNLKEIIKNTL